MSQIKNIKYEHLNWGPYVMRVNIPKNIIEDLNTDITASVKDNVLEQGEDTLTFLGNYVEQIDSDLDKHKLKNVIKDLYTEASER